MLKCCVCHKTDEELSPNGDLRPYGPGGQPICHACAMSTPELEAVAMSQLNKRMNAIEAAGKTVCIGNDLYGVQPFESEES